MKMIGETIRTEFEALKNDFETIRQQIEDDVVRTELYKGEFYELTPYSYQRNGCKQGKPVKRPDTIKSTKNLCIYGFNNQNQIVEVKVGCSIENQFYHTFLYYTDNLVRSLLYDNCKHLMNVCHYFFEGGKLKRSQLCGRYGCREENYIYKENEEELRQIAERSIPNLINGVAAGLKVDKNLTVYTALPDDDVPMEQYEEILSTLVKNHSLILIDCDFETDFGYFAASQEIYLVQSMDIITIQPLTAFLRDLQSKNIYQPENLRIVINKELPVKTLTVKNIIGGLSFYNDPSMSFMRELFNRETAKYCTIPFEIATYSKYLEGLVNCKISLNGYSKEFMQALRTLENMVYPLMEPTPASNRGAKSNNNYERTRFSNEMNDTLNQMKKNF